MAFSHVATGTGTDQDLLDLTRAAIAQILSTGQSYASDGRSLSRADLNALRETEKHYEAKIAISSGGGLVRNLISFKPG